jgi:hypothetical protein
MRDVHQQLAVAEGSGCVPLLQLSKQHRLVVKQLSGKSTIVPQLQNVTDFLAPHSNLSAVVFLCGEWVRSQHCCPVSRYQWLLQQQQVCSSKAISMAWSVRCIVHQREYFSYNTRLIAVALQAGASGAQTCDPSQTGAAVVDCAMCYVDRRNFLPSSITIPTSTTPSSCLQST